MKHQVIVGYWDLQADRPPSIFGQIQGTPTIKFLAPTKKSNRKHAIDYNGERTAKAMASFAVSRMPSHVERVAGQAGLDAFLEKASKYELPAALLVSKSGGKPMLKAMSVEFRRRMLIGEVRGSSSKNSDVLEHFGLSKSDLPKLIVLGGSSVLDTFDGKVSHHRVLNFFGKHALKNPVGKKRKNAAPSKDEV